MKILLFFFIFSASGYLQTEKQVTWQVKSQKISENEYTLVFKGKIKKGFYLYDSELKVDGPLVTTLSLDNKEVVNTLGPLIGIKPKTKYDEVWEGEISYFIKTAQFHQKISVKSKTSRITGIIKSQTCSESSGQCVLNNDPFEVIL
jgi:thiol:disulfide interchange protein DsbD